MGGMRSLPLLLLLGLVLGGCPSAHQPVLVDPPNTSQAAPPTLFRGVRVFDGMSDFLSEPMDVLVGGGRIAAMAPTGQREPPPGVVVVEGEGHTLLPGLVDMNVRFGGDLPAWAPGPHEPEVQAEALVWSGVTSVITAGRNVDLEGLQQRIAEGRVAGPRLHRSTRILSAEGSHPVPKGMLPWLVQPFLVDADVQRVDGTKDAVHAARHDLEYHRSDFVLIDTGASPPGTPTIKPKAIRAVVAETAMYEKRVFAMAARPSDAGAAVEAGAGALLITPWEAVLTDQEVEQIAFSGAAVVTAASMWPSLLDALEGEEVPGPIGATTRPAKPPKLTAEERTRIESYAENVRQNLRKLHQAGAPLLFGTASGIPGVVFGASVEREMAALADLGIPPVEVLRMATFLPVRLLDPGARFGVLAPGAYADLLLVEGDPTADPHAIAKVVGVWQAGARLDRRAAGTEPTAAAVP